MTCPLQLGQPSKARVILNLKVGHAMGHVAPWAPIRNAAGELSILVRPPPRPSR